MASVPLTDLNAYRTAFRLQQHVFQVTRSFPKEERYSLTDQVRRSSRSVGANIAEAWRKRSYPAHSVSKLSDADAELEETRHWLRTAHACGYLSDEDRDRLLAGADEAGRLVGSIMRRPGAWCRGP
ncbi:four helix bundle protein [Rubrivirga sp. S365]|uniref:four helix bundle protein n=1 Tax=Rubrivirga sp. S365 TaxID=3076080 RepID=UPI00391F1A2C